METQTENKPIVAKFGGTSLGNSQAFRQVLSILRNNPLINVVVVSATSGTTNKLVELFSLCREKNIDEARNVIKQIHHRHNTLFSELGLESKYQEPFTKILQNLSFIVEENLESSYYLTKSYRDQLLGFGEYLSSFLLTSLAKQEGINFTYGDSTEYIKTNSHFGKAEPKIALIRECCQSQLLPKLQAGQRIILQGFIGSDQHNKLTTLGRGGGDYTAALVAEGLHAQRLYVFTDVPGMYSTDPNLLKTSHIIDEISFSAAAELANFGAKVLHPSTLWPAVRKNISVTIKSTFTPESPGTTISRKSKIEPTIRAIALRKRQLLVTLSSFKMLNAHGFLASIFTILGKYKVSVDLVTTSEVSVALTIDCSTNDIDMDDTDFASYHSAMFDELGEFCNVQIEKDLSLIAIIGNRLNSTSGVASNVFSTLQDFNIRVVCHGASEHNLCFLINSTSAKNAVVRLHDQFFSEEQGEKE